MIILNLCLGFKHQKFPPGLHFKKNFWESWATNIWAITPFFLPFSGASNNIHSIPCGIPTNVFHQVLLLQPRPQTTNVNPN
jgi:hypothetical protein